MFGIISYRDLEYWDDICPQRVLNTPRNSYSYRPHRSDCGVLHEMIVTSQSFLDTPKQTSPGKGCYIILLGNLRNETPALKLVLDNYEYLNRRTRDVRFFMPGLIVNRDGIVASSHAVSHEEQFSFFEDGFLETVEWLEKGDSAYQYSESLEMILLPYEKMSKETSYDFEHMLSYNLDSLLAEEKNIIQFITRGVKVVQQRMTVEETKSQMEGEAVCLRPQSSCKIFIAGSKKLEQERDGIRAVFAQLHNRGSILYQTWTHEDFRRSFVEGGRQQEYNDFIENEADTIVFILNDKIGETTLSEFELALKRFNEFGHPNIYVYNHYTGDNEVNPEIQKVVDEINRHKQYYIPYIDITDLKNQIMRDYMSMQLRRDQ